MSTLRYALGIGCDRGTPAATICALIDEALRSVGASAAQVVGVGSIDLKADEAGLLAAVGDHGWPLRFFPAAALAEVAVPNPSETVRRHTGTPSVSEAAALLVASTGSSGRPLLVLEKLRRQGDDGRNATVSVALVTTAESARAASVAVLQKPAAAAA
jgi:cobalamin biosynthesis protein CbiG